MDDSRPAGAAQFDGRVVAQPREDRLQLERPHARRGVHALPHRATAPGDVAVAVHIRVDQFAQERLVLAHQQIRQPLVRRPDADVVAHRRVSGLGVDGDPSGMLVLLDQHGARRLVQRLARLAHVFDVVELVAVEREDQRLTAVRQRRVSLGEVIAGEPRELERQNRLVRDGLWLRVDQEVTLGDVLRRDPARLGSLQLRGIRPPPSTRSAPCAPCAPPRVARRAAGAPR